MVVITIYTKLMTLLLILWFLKFLESFSTNRRLFYSDYTENDRLVELCIFVFSFVDAYLFLVNLAAICGLNKSKINTYAHMYITLVGMRKYSSVKLGQSNQMMLNKKVNVYLSILIRKQSSKSSNINMPL